MYNLHLAKIESGRNECIIQIKHSERINRKPKYFMYCSFNYIFSVNILF